MLVLGLAMILLAEAPASPPIEGARAGASEAPGAPVTGARRPSTAAGACNTHNIQRAAVEPGALYVPGDPSVRLTPMTRLPDAHHIKTVLRAVDGRCEVVVAGYNVSGPRPAVRAPLSQPLGGPGR